MTASRRTGEGDRGAIVVEMALALPILVVILGSMVLFGRLTQAANTIELAAAQAAQAATSGDSAADARARAETAAGTVLSANGVACSRPAVVLVDTSQWGRPVGQPAAITVQVSCDVRLGDVALPAIPGTRTVSASAVSPLDTWTRR